MKKSFYHVFAIVWMMVSLSLSIINCHSAPTDADTQASVETAFKADPSTANITVQVKDGIATLSGECMNDAGKQHCTLLASEITGVKSVVNNCTIKALSDDELNKRLDDLTKDLSTLSSIKFGAMDGIIAIAGPVKKKEWESLKVELNKLAPKGYDTSMLNVER